MLCHFTKNPVKRGVMHLQSTATQCPHGLKSRFNNGHPQCFEQSVDSENSTECRHNHLCWHIAHCTKRNQSQQHKLHSEISQIIQNAIKSAIRYGTNKKSDNPEERRMNRGIMSAAALSTAPNSEGTSV
eukprot:5752267-Amphidinium_carterae.1